MFVQISQIFCEYIDIARKRKNIFNSRLMNKYITLYKMFIFLLIYVFNIHIFLVILAFTF